MYISFSLIAAILFVAGRTGISIFIGEFINSIFISKNYTALNWHYVALLFGFGFLWSGAQYLMYLFSGKLAIRISHNLRQQLYKQLIKLPLSYFHNNDSASIISITANDITLVETFLMTVMVQLFAQPLTIITIVSTMFILNWKLSLYFLILGPIIGLLLGLIGTKVQQLGSTMQENIASLTKIFSESIRHISVIKAFNSESIELLRFQEKNDHQLVLGDKEIRIRLLALPMSDFLGITAIILILSLGAIGIHMGVASAADVTKFVTMAIILSEPISSFNQLFLVVKKLTPSADRIFKIIDTPEEKDIKKENIGIIKGNINFHNINFSYHPHNPILKNINFSIKAGETIAIIGASGSGKSTLISLIPKFYLADSGEIFIDHKDISHHSSASIREHIALVTQDTSLFSDTIYNNITLSKPHATMDEIISAARIAHAHHFIMQHSDGYNRYVGDHGNNLSGGERQRIILARAVLRKPSILLLDEPTSALDAQSEKHITAALENIYGQQTTIIIAHKLHTIEKADKIIILKDGEISEIGSHKELIKKDGYYRQIYCDYNI